VEVGARITQTGGLQSIIYNRKMESGLNWKILNELLHIQYAITMQPLRIKTGRVLQSTCKALGSIPSSARTHTHTHTHTHHVLRQVPCAPSCHPSYFRAWGWRVSWAQEFETTLGNTETLFLIKNIYVYSSRVFNDTEKCLKHCIKESQAWWNL
jgi:hypothetical protein